MMGEMAVDRVELMYRGVHGRLWRALLSFTGDAEMASDAESEAFAQVLRRGAAIDDVAAWVWRSSFQIARGMLADRSYRPPAKMHSTAGTAIDPSVAEFLSMLHGLSPQQRACVVLRYVGGFTAPEIARLLDTTANTVRVQLGSSTPLTTGQSQGEPT